MQQFDAFGGAARPSKLRRLRWTERVDDFSDALALGGSTGLCLACGMFEDLKTYREAHWPLRRRLGVQRAPAGWCGPGRMALNFKASPGRADLNYVILKVPAHLIPTL